MINSIPSPYHPHTVFEGLRPLLVVCLVALVGMVGAGWIGVEIASHSSVGEGDRSVVTEFVGGDNDGVGRSAH